MALHALKPSLEEVQAALLAPNPSGNIIPVYTSLPSDLLTPVTAYLKLSSGADITRRSFLFESVTGGEKIGRYSFIGSDPLKIIRTGPGLDATGDPLVVIERELAPYKYIPIQGLPTFTGGAIGYISYDCVQYFEPRTRRELKDTLGIPESVFMVADSLIVFDHVFSTVRCVSHVHLPEALAGKATEGDVEKLYNAAKVKVDGLIATLTSPITPMPVQPPILTGQESVSNVGKAGYEGFVTSLRANIVKGDIIQAVPSQRLTRRTTLHPFNCYRHLRQVNPSPYMFYVDCGDAQLVGASPETLCKIEAGKVAVHAIAGTVKRGKDDEEDRLLASQLAGSVKDQAEHVMLVDLARNDINRVCDPATTQVETFMNVEKFSHVMHLTSRITGQLRGGKSRFDALRSIFPAGTVSGAPKIRAIELVSELEGEKRGVYAGAVGRIDFAENEMDVCIAIRTMTFKDGYAYLQAGGGIVYDSVEEDEYVETINKLASNVRCIAQAEEYYLAQEK
ncbi:Anthranilate synthase component I, N-terminal [Kalmanozyma brasiliensis GHG001]|uniref:Putative TRP2-anthranilate synthase component I n=1 Tax=Kalmanozyma brasiliensis (strain GHG001) TaxID=1365824 RepID=V5F0S1_KALBG|nr:Anthranilate synthase component I, N-terminal [Kalmanozyma brasiliensis GHG001]EST09923.1 Anthranilate synthase component I, N-terminal [Kalmanozyma brasiliensis GHG001]